MPALREHAITLVSSTAGIDVTSVGTTELFNVPAGKHFVPLFVVIRCTSFTVGSMTTHAVVSFGGNSPSYDDFLSGVTYVVEHQDYYQIDRPSDATEVPVQPPGTSFCINVETASDAETEVWAVDLFGYLF